VIVQQRLVKLTLSIPKILRGVSTHSVIRRRDTSPDKKLKMKKQDYGK